MFASGHNYAGAAGRNNREWIYHLRIAPAAKTSSGFPKITVPWLDTLIGRLKLSGGISLEASELLPGVIRHPDQHSPWAVCVPWNLDGRSYELAVAVGLLAAEAGRAVPADILFSGALAPAVSDETGPAGVRLAPIGSLRRKLALALGVSGSRDAIEHLTTHLCGHPNTAEILGPVADRVVPGKVTLFVTSGEPEAMEGYEKLDIHLASVVSRLTPDERLEKAEGGILLAVVEDVAAAAALAGVAVAGPEPKTVLYRVRRDARTFRQLHADDRRLAAECVLAAFRDETAGRPDPAAELNRLLQILMRELNVWLGRPDACFAGDVAVSGDEPNWLDTVARQNAAAVPVRYPADIGLSGRVVRENAWVVVPDTAASPDFRTAVSPGNPAAERYSAEGFAEYMAFLRRVRGCVKVPIVGLDGTVAAVVALHVCEPGLIPADQAGQTELGEHLTWLAGLGLSAVIGLQKTYSPDGPEAFVVRDFEYKPDDRHGGALTKRRELLAFGAQLTRWACQNLAGSTRSLLRVLGPDRETLYVVGTHGFELSQEAWEQKHAKLSYDTAAGAAVLDRVSIWHENTLELARTAARKRFEPIPPEVGKTAWAVAAILLRAQGRIVGVLNIDWPQPRAFPAEFKKTVESALARPANALLNFLTEAEFNDLAVSLDKLAPEDAPSSAENPVKEPARRPDPTLEQSAMTDALSSMARIAGDARYAMLFLREAGSGCFVPAVALGHSDGWRADPGRQAGFPFGVGMIGWVARRKQSIRLANAFAEIDDPAGVTSVDTDDPPKWERKLFFQREFEGIQQLAYLAVPVIGGGEVLGVLRFAHPGGLFQFDPVTARLAAEAANRLGAVLYKLQARRWSEAWTKMFPFPSVGATVEDVAAHIFDRLSEYLGGECAASIRVLDDLREPTGSPTPVLRRVASTPNIAGGLGAIFRTAESAGLAAAVLREGREIICLEANSDRPAGAKYRRLVRASIDDVVRDRTESYPSVIGLPLKAADETGTEKLCGTLYVCRRNPNAFTVTELRHIRMLAEVLGSQLAATDKAEEAAISRKLSRALCKQLDSPEPSFVRRLAGAWLPDIQAYLRAGRGGAFLLTGGHYCCVADDKPAFSAADWLREMAGERSRVVSVPANVGPLAGLLPDTSARSRAILSVGDGPVPKLVMGFLGRNDDAISGLRVGKVQEELGLLAGLVGRFDNHAGEIDRRATHERSSTRSKGHE